MYSKFIFRAVSTLLFLGLLSHGIANALPYDNVVLADGPLAYYRFSETAGSTIADSASSVGAPNFGSQNGTNNNVTLAQIGPRPIGGFPGFSASNTAGGFDGSSSYVDLGSQIYNQLGAISPSAITVETWVNPSNLTGNQTLFGTRINSGQAGMEIILNSGGFVRVAGRSSASDSYQQVVTSTSLSTDQWQQVVGVIDYPNDKISIYVNGSLAIDFNATFSQNTYTLGTPTQNDTIGRSPAATIYFNGRLDDLSIYAYRLDETQIMAHYLAATQTPAPIPEPASFLLIGLGAIGLIRPIRRHNRKA